MNKTRPK